MLLKLQDGRYVFECRFDERAVPKENGFCWDGQAKCWATASPDVAHRLLAHATPEARIAIGKAMAGLNAVREMSSAAASDFVVLTPEGMVPFPFQKAGVEFMLRSNPVRALLADEQGLGKSAQSIMVINARTDIRKVLVVCPASLKINWRRELEMWQTRGLTTWIVNSGDTLPDVDILIVNFDILFRMQEAFAGRKFDLVVADEIHRIKNPKGKNAKAFNVICDSRHRLALTGTPILNRPIEIQNVLAWLDKPNYGNRWAFAKRYCDMKQTRFGIDMKGASNLDELARRLRSGLMVRRLKKDVLKELPTKIHQVVELPANGLSRLVAGEWDTYKKNEAMLAALKTALTLAKAAETDAEYLSAIDRLKHGAAAAFSEMSKARLELAKAKVPYVLAHLSSLMEDVDKLVTFGHHTEVIDEVVSKMKEYRPVCITGQTPNKKRDEAVQAFQHDPETRLFVGNIIAAGVGLTLTAASTVVLYELDWRPGIVAQAVDRCHRIGQKDSVLAQYLVVEGSLDSYMAKTIAAKAKVIEQALGIGETLADPEDFELPAVDEKSGAAPTPVKRKELVDCSTRVRQGDMEIVLSALRIIAALDVDYAASKNMVGFSKMDVQIGHSLCEKNWLSPKQVALGVKLAHRYRTQLPDASAVEAVYRRVYATQEKE